MGQVIPNFSLFVHKDDLGNSQGNDRAPKEAIGDPSRTLGGSLREPLRNAYGMKGKLNLMMGVYALLL